MRGPASCLQRVLHLLLWRCSPPKYQEVSSVCKSNVGTCTRTCTNVRKPGAPFCLSKWNVTIVVEISTASAGERFDRVMYTGPSPFCPHQIFNASLFTYFYIKIISTSLDPALVRWWLEVHICYSTRFWCQSPRSLCMGIQSDRGDKEPL